MPQTDYKLTIDDSGVVKSLTVIDKKFDEMGKSGDDAMKKVSKGGLSMSHVMSGAVGGAFTALAGAAIEFGKAAVGAFADVIKGGVQAAAQFDTTKKKFTSMFDGQEDQAVAVMDSIGQHAVKIGLDMNEALSLGAAFLPDVKGSEAPLEMLNKISGAVQGLALETPEQGVFGIRLGIEEALSGNLNSLRDRADLQGRELDIIKAAQVEYGETIGLIEGINQVLEDRGVKVEDAAKSLAGAAGQVGFTVTKLQIAMGKPITDELVESMGGLNKILAENSDDLELVAAAIGDVVTNVVDFVSSGLTDFLGDLDFEKFVTFGESLTTLAEKGRLVTELLFDMGDATPNEQIDGLTKKTDKLSSILNTGAQAVALIKAEFAAMAADLNNVGNMIGFVTSRLNIFAEDKSLEEVNAEHIDSTEAFNASMRKSLATMDKSSERMAENKKRQEERKEAQDADTEAALAGAEAFLKQGDAASETADALTELGLAEEDLEKIQEDVVKTQEKLVKAAEKFAQERLDIARDFLQERADLELEFSQERADITRKSLEDIAAIETDHQHALEDQGLQLGRNARDLGKKQGKERADAEKDLRQDLLDVEQNFQDELRRIQRTAQQAMEEAERGLDAQAFVAALRQQEVSLEEAAITREGAEADVRDEAGQRLKDLEQAQAEERAALRQADQDKLEDLQIRLTREFEAQALSDQLAFEQQGIDEERRLEQQVISEQRRLEEQAIDEQRQLEALIQAQAERLAKMVEGLDAETAAVVLAEANKLAAVEDFAGSAQAVLDGLIANVKAKAKEVEEPASTPRPRSGRPRLGGVQEDAGNVVPNKPGLFLPIIQKRRGGGVRAGHPYRVGEAGLEGYIPRRAFGGDTRIGQPTIIGEFGEELFIPPSSGTIIPNNQMGSFLGNTTNMQQSTSNTQNNLGGFSVSQSMFEDPIQRGQLENFILDIMSRN